MDDLRTALVEAERDTFETAVAYAFAYNEVQRLCRYENTDPDELVEAYARLGAARADLIGDIGGMIEVMDKIDELPGPVPTQ